MIRAKQAGLFTSNIHLNPVRAKRFGASRSDYEGPSPEQIAEMVEELQEFKWGSYGAYAGYSPVPKWLYTEAILGLVPGRTLGAKFALLPLEGRGFQLPLFLL